MNDETLGRRARWINTSQIAAIPKRSFASRFYGPEAWTRDQEKILHACRQGYLTAKAIMLISSPDYGKHKAVTYNTELTADFWRSPGGDFSSNWAKGHFGAVYRGYEFSAIGVLFRLDQLTLTLTDTLLPLAQLVWQDLQTIAEDRQSFSTFDFSEFPSTLPTDRLISLCEAVSFICFGRILRGGISGEFDSLLNAVGRAKLRSDSSRPYYSEQPELEQKIDSVVNSICDAIALEKITARGLPPCSYDGNRARDWTLQPVPSGAFALGNCRTLDPLYELLGNRLPGNSFIPEHEGWSRLEFNPDEIKQLADSTAETFAISPGMTTGSTAQPSTLEIFNSFEFQLSSGQNQDLGDNRARFIDFCKDKYGLTTNQARLTWRERPESLRFERGRPKKPNNRIKTDIG